MEFLGVRLAPEIKLGPAIFSLIAYIWLMYYPFETTLYSFNFGNGSVKLGGRKPTIPKLLLCATLSWYFRRCFLLITVPVTLVGRLFVVTSPLQSRGNWGSWKSQEPTYQEVVGPRLLGEAFPLRNLKGANNGTWILTRRDQGSLLVMSCISLNSSFLFCRLGIKISPCGCRA